jgi:5-methylcytosine-specific restriction endonuclease McrA
MDRFALDQLSDAALLRRLSELVAKERANTAELLALIAEVDARRLYADAGRSSMFAFCVRDLHLSEDEAGKRITAARAARRFPPLLRALEQGRIHLTAACILAPHLNDENIETLIQAATRKGRAEIEAWLAGRSMMTPVAIRPCTIKPIVARPTERAKRDDGLALPFDSPETTVSAESDAPPEASAPPDAGRDEHAPERVPVSSNRTLQHAPERVDPPKLYRVQLTIPRNTHDTLRRVQALLGHALPSGDVAQVFDRALNLLLRHLENRKAGATRAKRTPRPSRNRRRVSASVRRAVWDRDQGRCTFVSASGTRCEERTRLEFDHVVPVARGGTPTLDGIRLRCRAHNQLEANRVFGASFMERKRRRRRATSADEPRARRPGRWA